MPTKYELQAELRELNRGQPRLAISKMKMHELEGAIDAVKKIKAEIASKTPMLPGPKGPRAIPVEEVESGPLTIRTPKVPPVRNMGIPKGAKAGKAISFESDSIEDDEPLHEPVDAKKIVKMPKKVDSGLFPKFEPGPASPRPIVRAKSAPVSVHFCNCPDCPRPAH